MDDRLLGETAWHRGRRDTWSARDNRWFWGAEVIGTPLVAITYGPVNGLMFLAGTIIAVWIGATVAAPVRQRNEARVLARQRRGEVTRLKSGPDIRVSAHRRAMDIRELGPGGQFSVHEAVVVKAWNASSKSTGLLVPWVRYYGPEGQPWHKGEPIQRSWIEPGETQGSSAQAIPKTPPTEHAQISLAATGVPFDVLVAHAYNPQRGESPGIPLGGGISNVIPEAVTLWAQLRIAGDGMPTEKSW